MVPGYQALLLVLCCLWTLVVLQVLWLLWSLPRLQVPGLPGYLVVRLSLGSHCYH